MARPKLPESERKIVIRPVLSLHPILDEDIIKWWGSLLPGGRARAMVDRLRNGASDEDEAPQGVKVEASEEMMNILGSLLDEEAEGE